MGKAMMGDLEMVMEGKEKMGMVVMEVKAVVGVKVGVGVKEAKGNRRGESKEGGTTWRT